MPRLAVRYLYRPGAANHRSGRPVTRNFNRTGELGTLNYDKTPIAQAPLDRIDLFVSGKGGYRKYRIPALVVSARGTVLAFCEARRHTGEDYDEIDILLCRSHDGGRTWDAGLTVVTDGDRTCGNPCPVVDNRTGAIVLPFCKDNQQVFVTRSEDDGINWSEPEEITDCAKDSSWSYLGTGPGHGIQLGSGRLLVPCWSDASPGPVTWRNPSPSAGKIQSSFALLSDDGGRTWQRGEEMTTDASDECAAVELRDGTVYMNMRSRQDKRLRAFSRSTDGGRTWTPVEYDPTLPEPSCQGSLVRLDERRVVLSHPSNADARTHLTVRLSSDDCRTWPVARVLDEGSAAYSDLTVADRHILCLYEADSYGRMILARFTPDWLESEA